MTQIKTITEYTRNYPLSSRHPLSNQWTGQGFNQGLSQGFGFENQRANFGWNMLNYGCQSTPQVDILDLDEQYILQIALPGVVLDDVELKAEENCLTVVAKRTPAMFEERAHIVRKELPQGYLVRQFSFEAPVLIEQIEARMDRGILFVSVPKLEVARRIPVSAGSIDMHIPGLKTNVPHKNDVRKEVSVK
jgi:HSP20 family protein